ncbi:MAG: hypothetical protein ACOYBE_11090 [Blautia sp.]|jgi:hypothetical protein
MKEQREFTRKKSGMVQKKDSKREGILRAEFTACDGPYTRHLSIPSQCDPARSVFYFIGRNFLKQSGQAHLKLPHPSIFERLESFARQMHFPLVSVRIPPGGLLVSSDAIFYEIEKPGISLPRFSYFSL